MANNGTSKFISLILRHKPEVIGITLDEHGWARVDEPLAGVSRTHPLDMSGLDEPLTYETEWSKKRRFSDEFARALAYSVSAVVCEAGGISLEDTVAFGDDLNDIEMLKLCGKGIAVANAVPQVLEAADGITLSNDEDGPAVWLADHCLDN